MMFQCVNCGNPVENETAGTAAECCDACRNRWRDKAILEAMLLLTGHGYIVTLPKQVMAQMTLTDAAQGLVDLLDGKTGAVWPIEWKGPAEAVKAALAGVRGIG